eukprot:9485703-Heterocapsa_arctica.AAC.1
MQVLYERIALLEELLRGASERLERPYTDSDVSSPTSTDTEERSAQLAKPWSPAMTVIVVEEVAKKDLEL